MYMEKPAQKERALSRARSLTLVLFPEFDSEKSWKKALKPMRFSAFTLAKSPII